MAAAYGHVESVIALIEKGANIDARDKYGNTVLIKAAERCHVDATIALICRGALVEVKDEWGRTALDIFMTSDEICRCLGVNVRLARYGLERRAAIIAPGIPHVM